MAEQAKTSLPIALFPQHVAVPDHYMVHLHSVHCSGCKTLHEYPQVYASCSFRPRLGMGTYGRHLVPVTDFSYNVPIHWTRIPPITVPACAECCNTLTLSHLPSPPRPEPRIVGLSPRAEATEGSGAGSGTTGARKPTTIDLLGDI